MLGEVTARNFIRLGNKYDLWNNAKFYPLYPLRFLSKYTPLPPHYVTWSKQLKRSRTGTHIISIFSHVLTLPTRGWQLIRVSL